ncbi:7705_t:CDS:1 [Diversispora eburnea]|uniref:7705_t:CDS:1 n=1 Tax=Diversispora eburnea TaxID=1213867 RepID=A0A9N9AQN5_9GLOM|nr:7705_t:CDS:1 [Diversispora eburnea]
MGLLFETNPTEGPSPIGYQFQDLSKSIQKLPWSKSKATPSWKLATHGLNLEGKFDVTEIKLRNKLTFFFHIFSGHKGYCKNILCEAYENRVIIMWGYRNFDFYYNEHKCRCPRCNKYVEPITCGFVNTHWKYEGVKKVKGHPPEKVRCDWKFAEDDGYTTFEREDIVSWQRLTISIKKP